MVVLAMVMEALVHMVHLRVIMALVLVHTVHLRVIMALVLAHTVSLLVMGNVVQLLSKCHNKHRSSRLLVTQFSM
jgi:hypothetical protein